MGMNPGSRQIGDGDRGVRALCAQAGPIHGWTLPGPGRSQISGPGTAEGRDKASVIWDRDARTARDMHSGPLYSP